jgi:hypothetical protein
MKTDSMRISAAGHVVIRDIETREVLVDQHNDIHVKNFGDAIAWALATMDKGFIEEMHFGSGGSTVTTTGEISYLATNVNDAPDQADLHNPAEPAIFKVVNDRSSNFVGNPTKNNIKVVTNNVNPWADIVVTCTLDYGEPAGQALVDNATSMDGDFIFDEIALKTYDATTNKKRMLTHVIFHPVQKSLNRAIEIVYTLRISMVAGDAIDLSNY